MMCCNRKRDNFSQNKPNEMVKSMALNLVVYVLTSIRRNFNFAVDAIAAFLWDSKKQSIADVEKSNAVLLESATSLALRIKSKQMTSEALVRLCIARIKEVNPVLNAVTDQRYDLAIKEAKAIDKQISDGTDETTFKNKPFLGVPFTAKESFTAKGLLNTLGLKARLYTRADEDAEVVRLMKQAGAILLAVTNVPELNRWQETYNLVHGLTCNPYDSTRSVGGSSGGEGALVSAAASPLGLCTDIGGSTRMPAFYCGLFAHNPTAGLVNMRGATLRTGEEKNSMVSAGLVCRHSEDLLPVIEVLAAEKAPQLNLKAPFNITKVKVYYIEEVSDLKCSPINRELKEALRRVVENLSVGTGRQAQCLEVGALSGMCSLWRYWMGQEPVDFPSLLANKTGRVNGLVEMIKKIFGQSDFTLSSIVSLLDQQLLPSTNSEWAETTTKLLRDELTSKLGLDGVLVFPSAPRCAPHHYTAFLRPWDFGYWAVWNAIRFPATQVPLGLNSGGLPLGVQIVAAPFNDALAIKVAQYLDEQFGGYVPPCRVSP